MITAKDFIREKGYDEPIKFDFFNSQTNISILREYIPGFLRKEDENIIDITVEAEEDSVPISSIKTINYFLENQNEFLPVIIDKLLKYYCEELYPNYISEREEFNLDQSNNFPKITKEDKKQALLNNYLSKIYVPIHINEGAFSLIFESKWEEEHGVGITFENYNFKEIGASEIAIEPIGIEGDLVREKQLKNGLVIPEPPPIFMKLSHIDYVVHWKWINTGYILVKKMKGEFDENEVEIEF